MGDEHSILVWQNSRNGQILIQVRSLYELCHSGFVLAEGRIDQTHIGQNLGGICDTL